MKATWLEILLTVLRIISIGVVLGVFLIGIPLSYFFGATYMVGISSGVIGIFLYEAFLWIKDNCI